MFVGETLCLFLCACGVHSPTPKRKERFKPLMMLPAAVCDMIASVLQYLALLYTFPSHVAVLLGVNSLFTGLFAMVFLNQRLGPHQWFGSAMIAIGAAFIGGCSALYNSSGAPETMYHASFNPLLGDMFAVLAQLFRPGQYILEERVVSRYDCSVAEAVGFEGMFGALVAVAAIPIFMSVRGPDGLPLDDMRQAMLQLRYAVDLQVVTVCLVAVATVYNFIAISITRNSTASVRAAINALRTCAVWLFSLWVGWEDLCELQILGFLFVVGGTSVFNEAIPRSYVLPLIPAWLMCADPDAGEGESDGEGAPLIAPVVYAGSGTSGSSDDEGAGYDAEGLTGAGTASSRAGRTS